MNDNVPKPGKEFLKLAAELKQLIDRQESATRGKARQQLEKSMVEHFMTEFGLTPDRKHLARNFYYRFINTEFVPKKTLFDHVDFFQRGANLVMVSQPYGIEADELARWAQECQAAYTIANDWSYHYPGYSSLFFVEFTPQAKAALDKCRRAA